MLKHLWIPPSNYEFPIFQNRRLKFQTDWLRRYAWLVYSKYVEGALCKTRELYSNDFAGKGSHQKLGALIKVPFTKRKDAMERFN